MLSQIDQRGGAGKHGALKNQVQHFLPQMLHLVLERALYNFENLGRYYTLRLCRENAAMQDNNAFAYRCLLTPAIFTERTSV